MCLTTKDNSNPWGNYGGGANEWLLIDDERKDRFGHLGETIIPGSGDRWGHLDSRWGGAMEPSSVRVDANGDASESFGSEVTLASNEAQDNCGIRER